MNGKDATSAFTRAGHSQYAKNLMKSMIVGTVGKESVVPPKTSVVQQKDAASKMTSSAQSSAPQPATVQPKPTTPQFSVVTSAHIPSLSKQSQDPEMIKFASPRPMETKNTMYDTNGNTSVLSGSQGSNESPLSSRTTSASATLFPPTPASSIPSRIQSTSAPSSNAQSAPKQVPSTVPSLAPPAPIPGRPVFPATPAEIQAFATSPHKSTSFSFGRPFHVDPGSVRPDQAARIAKSATPGADALDFMLPDLAELTSPGLGIASKWILSPGYGPLSPSRLGDSSGGQPGIRLALRCTRGSVLIAL